MTRPAQFIGFEQPFEMVPWGLRDPQHGDDVGTAWKGCSLAPVYRMSNLVEIPPKGSELRDAALEGHELFLRQWGEAAKVGAHQDRSIGGGCHSASRCSLVKEKAVLGSQTDIQARIPSVTLWLPFSRYRLGQRRSGLAQRPDYQALEPYRFGDEQLASKRVHALLLFEGDAVFKNCAATMGHIVAR